MVTLETFVISTSFMASGVNLIRILATPMPDNLGQITQPY